MNWVNAFILSFLSISRICSEGTFPFLFYLESWLYSAMNFGAGWVCAPQFPLPKWPGACKSGFSLDETRGDAMWELHHPLQGPPNIWKPLLLWPGLWQLSVATAPLGGFLVWLFSTCIFHVFMIFFMCIFQILFCLFWFIFSRRRRDQAVNAVTAWAVHC